MPAILAIHVIIGWVSLPNEKQGRLKGQGQLERTAKIVESNKIEVKRWPTRRLDPELGSSILIKINKRKKMNYSIVSS